MGQGLRFDGRVVLVTGAGNGLGKAHAMMFAARGAKVVVNDLGGSAFGDGQSTSAADLVVDAIKSAGGEAVANYHSVEDGDACVQTAIDTWGRIDIVVNNAGILRDVSFHKMSEDDWDLIYRVHVRGTYKVTAAAWPYMREQRYGRIIMTSSAAGIYGNFGQANYSMAKMGVFGLGSTLAVEGAGRDIHVNTIAPIAGSRLTETVLPQEITDALKPEFVSPLVGWLCHESCTESGSLFEVGGGYFSKLRWERAAGKTFRLGRAVHMEGLKAGWDEVTRFDEGSSHPKAIAESMGPVMENIQAGPSLGGNEFIDVDTALGYTFPEVKSSYGEREVALYALGVGAGAQPSDPKDLQLVYERHGNGFHVLPTFGVIPAMKVMMDRALAGETAPGLNYGVERLLHGEQFMSLTRPLPPKATLTHKAVIKDIWDKGKGAIVNMAIESYDEDGDVLVHNEFVSFVRGAGGWGGERGPSKEVNVPPSRAPDAVVEEQISENQAVIYRLSGDWNPLHVDPAFAQAFGFDKPILHGLCTFGFATRHVIQRFSDGDPRFFKSIKVRFAESVFPGETLVTQMWQDGEHRVVFECRVKERDAVVLSNAAIELFDEIPQKVTKSVESPATAEPVVDHTPISADIFEGLKRFLKAEPSVVEKIGKVFQFTLSEPASTWTLDLKAGGVSAGAAAKADCTLELSEGDFMAMCMGEVDPQKLYFGGQLKISGDVMASQKLNFLQTVERQYFEDALADRIGGGDKATPTTPSSSVDGPTSADAFLGIHAHVGDTPELVQKVQTVFGFVLSNPDSAWTLDLKNEPGGVVPGLRDDVDCTLALSDGDFMDMVSGIADPQKLYFGGQLKISGNIMASQKLSFLQSLDPNEMVQRVQALKADGHGFEVAATSAHVQGAAAAASVFESAEGVQSPGDDVTIQCTIVDPDSHWTMSIMAGLVNITSGVNESADAHVRLSDSDLGRLSQGEVNVKALFQTGALRVDGDVFAVHRLACLNSAKQAQESGKE